MHPLYKQWQRREDLSQEQKIDLILELCGILVQNQFYQTMLTEQGDSKNQMFNAMSQVGTMINTLRSSNFDKEQTEKDKLDITNNDATV